LAKDYPKFNTYFIAYCKLIYYQDKCSNFNSFQHFNWRLSAESLSPLFAFLSICRKTSFHSRWKTASSITKMWKKKINCLERQKKLWELNHALAVFPMLCQHSRLLMNTIFSCCCFFISIIYLQFPLRYFFWQKSRVKLFLFLLIFLFSWKICCLFDEFLRLDILAGTFSELIFFRYFFIWNFPPFFFCLFTNYFCIRISKVCNFLAI